MRPFGSLLPTSRRLRTDCSAVSAAEDPTGHHDDLDLFRVPQAISRSDVRQTSCHAGRGVRSAVLLPCQWKNRSMRLGTTRSLSTAADGWRLHRPPGLRRLRRDRRHFPRQLHATRSRPRHVIRSGRVRLARRRSADQHFQKGSHHDQMAAGRDSQPDQPHSHPAAAAGSAVAQHAAHHPHRSRRRRARHRYRPAHARQSPALPAPTRSSSAPATSPWGYSRTPSCSRRR
jgi:hypothetical protein